jgi:4a-hydroxytetrahydrobiopterin dehydratase
VSRPPRLDEAVVATWLAAHPSWSPHDGHLTRVVAAPDYRRAVELVAAQADVAERLDHHPVITLGYREVVVELWTHDRGGITSLDLEYAEAFDRLVERDR